MIKEKTIAVDIDKSRIREVVGEALRIVHDFISEDFKWTDQGVMDQLEVQLASNRVATQFFIPIGCNRMPDLVLRVDPIRREVLCRSALKKRVAELNHLIRVL